MAKNMETTVFNRVYTRGYIEENILELLANFWIICISNIRETAKNESL